MIISASYRTDAAFCIDQLISTISAARERGEPIEGAVIWTRKPESIFEIGLTTYLQEAGIPCVIHVSLTDYGEVGLEAQTPPLWARVTSVKQLSSRVGWDRVIWRYDPIILGVHNPSGNRYPMDTGWHAEKISEIGSRLRGRVSHCVTSIMYPYRHVRARLEEASVPPIDYMPSPERIRGILRVVKEFTEREEIPLRYCGPLPGIKGRDILDELEIPSAHCVDASLFGLEPDPANLRPGCSCDRSVDVGDYDTCGRGCLFCYANQGRY